MYRETHRNGQLVWLLLVYWDLYSADVRRLGDIDSLSLLLRNTGHSRGVRGLGFGNVLNIDFGISQDLGCRRSRFTNGVLGSRVRGLGTADGR